MSPSRTALGRFLRDLRLRQGLDQRRFARLLGWSQPKIGDLERGTQARLKEPDLQYLARRFRVDPEEIRRLLPPPPRLLPPTTPLAKLIRARREALGLSRLELARRAGINHLHLALTLERDARGLRYDMMTRLARALDLDPDTLLPFVSAWAVKAKGPLGTTIRRRRQQLGMSAGKLARKAGIEKITVLGVERGTIQLSRDARNLRTLRRLARALDMPADHVIALRRPRVRLPGGRRPTLRTLGGYLTQARLRRFWSQAEAAGRVDLAPATICHIEQDQRVPRVSTLCRLADALDLDVETLITLSRARRERMRKSRDRKLRARRREQRLLARRSRR
jgi:transcriptional regulator with XRE-family HTH domain